MGEVIIRDMTIDDLPEVMVVEYQSFSSPWTKRDFIFDLLKNQFSHYIVLEKDGQVVGYCGVWVVLEAAQITNIAILPEQRGHKYGEQLFRRMLQVAEKKGATELSLEVRESNIVAQNMYKKFGMKVVGKRERYYKDDGEDALVMWVRI
ncbi:ribosomal protein S18-alanine N-acetyltransferase [Bacillaceae bacterium W0354]